MRVKFESRTRFSQNLWISGRRQM